MTTRIDLRALALAGILVAPAGCSSDTANNPNGSGASDAGTMGPSRGGTGADASTTPPPEVEARVSFLQPRAGGRYLYVLNPLRDSVAVIDSSSLAIETVEVGRRPESVLTADGQDLAVVLDTGSVTASILRTTNGHTTVSHVPSFDGANAIAIAPDSRHAVIYLDTDAAEASVGGGSFQDITVVNLAEGNDTALRLTVGFRPQGVLFSRDGSAAFVVTEDGISILRFADLTGPTLVPSVSLADQRVGETVLGGDAGTEAGAGDAADAGGDSGGDDASAGDAGADDASAPGPEASTGTPDASVNEARTTPLDVSITPDGLYAIARTEGSSVVRLVDLTARTIRRLDLGGAVTDLDLASDGTFALAVLRAESRVIRIDVPAGFGDPAHVRGSELQGEFFGSVTIAPDGHRALLYTTVTDERRVLVMDLAGTDGTIGLALRKTVRAVAFAPDSRTALVLHRVSAGSPDQPGIDLQTRLDRTPGYSMVEPAARFVKLQLTDADVGPFAIVPGGSHAFLLFRDDARHVAAVHRVDLRSFVVENIALGSPPLSVGAVSATGRVFVGQEHPEGRVTFIDWATGALQSVTGFELNSRIVN